MIYASPSHHRTEKIVKIVILLKNPRSPFDVAHGERRAG